jgi:hypothetical protein
MNKRREAKQIRALLLLVLQKGSSYFFLFLIISHQHGSLSSSSFDTMLLHPPAACSPIFYQHGDDLQSPYQKWSHPLQCLVIKPHDAPQAGCQSCEFHHGAHT